MFSLLFSLVSFASPDAKSIATAIDTFNTHSYIDVPKLSSSNVQKLLKGKVVTLVNNGKATEKGVEKGKAVAYYISDLPKEKLWVSFQDPHFQVQENTTELLFQKKSADNLVWYGFMDLSWPMSDRHWVVRVWNNHELAKKTDNRMWEHPWKLVKDGKEQVRSKIEGGALPKIKKKMFDDAIYLPESTGAWVMIDVDDSTLMIYSATATVGGAVPEGLMMNFLLSSMNRFMKDGEKRARGKVPSHYNSSHKGIYGGDGKIISGF